MADQIRLNLSWVRLEIMHQGVTCNTISHPTNEIDLLPALSEAIKKMITG